MLLHIILDNTVEGGEHEEIMIDGVRDITTDDNCLRIFSDEIMAVHPAKGKFFLSNIVGWWLEKE